MKRYEYANGGYLTIELIEDDFFFENKPIILEKKKTPFELEVSSIKEDIMHLDSLMERLKKSDSK